MSEIHPTISPALIPANNELNALCELIRHEKVILWVGSGFSSYAGYPTGSQLPAILLAALGELPSDAPDPRSASLKEVADYYVAAKDRDSLIYLLKEHYCKTPLRFDVHESLALINRVKYIITTNYDPLFEHAYGDRIVKIAHDDELPSSTDYPEKTVLLKIHGDLSDPNSVVITSDDYDKFDKDSIIWGKIRSLLAEYSVVFIGYSISDPNVEEMLRDIHKRLKERKHPYYFIDSKIDEKMRVHLSDYALHYIEMDATVAIDYITGNTIEYAFVDGMKNPALLSKSDQIFDRKGFRVDRSFTAGKITHASLVPTRPGVHSSIGLTLSSKTSESSDLIDFHNLITGYSFEPVTLRAPTCDITIRKAEMNGVITIDPTIKTFQYLELKPHPVKEALVDLQLEQQPFRLGNLRAKIYNSAVLLKLEIEDPDFTFTLYVTHATRAGKINFETHQIISDIDRARTIYGLLDGWIQGDNLKILSNGFDGSLTIPSQSVDNTPGIPSMREFYQLYSDLSDIQTVLKIKLQLPVDEIKAEDCEIICQVATLLRGRKELINEVTTTFSNTEQIHTLLNKKDTPGVQFSGDGWKEFSLFNKVIKVPVVIEGFDLILTNEHEIQAAIQRGDKDLRFRWKSKTGKFYGRFATFPSDEKVQTGRQKEVSQ